MDFLKDLRIKEEFGDDWTDEEIKDSIKEDYQYLIDLRNRIADGTDDDTILYEEDHITLDHILDYMEIIIENLKLGDKK